MLLRSKSKDSFLNLISENYYDMGITPILLKLLNIL